MSVNAVTQACMSFTSQNYSVGKQKRMDRVLLDCMILRRGRRLSWESEHMYSEHRFWESILRIKK